AEDGIRDATVTGVQTCALPIFDPQDPAAGHLGDSVTVEGALDGDTIRVASIKLLTGIGLAAGQKAPAFYAPDQFGAPQTLETLKDRKSVVLLFFRSADR